VLIMEQERELECLDHSYWHVTMKIQRIYKLSVR